MAWMMEYAWLTIAYVAVGCVLNLMDGYARPQIQADSPAWANWLVVATWPFRVATIFGGFGAALRVGWKP